MTILLQAGVSLLILTLALAWVGTFTRIFPVKGLEGELIKDYDALIKGHLDYALMAMLLIIFYAAASVTQANIDPLAGRLAALGATTNPFFFLLLAVKPDALEVTFWKIYAAASFVITTVGFIWVAVAILMAGVYGGAA